jgi:hypothetical protein
MRLSTRQSALLAAVAAGDVLKVHRSVDGEKVYRLHPLSGAEAVEVGAADVEALERGGFTRSNMKFPAATFLLTEQGLRRVRGDSGNDGKTIAVR